MQIIRLEVVKQNHFLGRVDRDFEDVIPFEINAALAGTAAVYDLTDIATKTILLTEILTKLTDYLKAGTEQHFQEWIMKQLENEKNKLKITIQNAQA